MTLSRTFVLAVTTQKCPPPARLHTCIQSLIEIVMRLVYRSPWKLVPDHLQRLLALTDGYRFW